MHLVVDISSHGFGHLSQVAPVVNALAARHAGLRLTVRTRLPQAVVAGRIGCAFEHVATSMDIGLLMSDALHVDLAASLEAYRAFHAGWRYRVEAAAVELEALRPDLLLADVPYLSLAAAARAGVPAVALCSLNWADVVLECLGADDFTRGLCASMGAAYESAQVFLRPEPAMPMDGLANTRPIGVIAQQGTGRRAELEEALGLAPGTRLAVVSMGGVPHAMDAARWPAGQGWHFLLADAAPDAPHATDYRTLPYAYLDLVASCDALVTKSGYGSFTEAAVAGKPLLYLPRQWPEEGILAQWLGRVGRCAPLRAAQLEGMAFIDALEAVRAQPAPPPVHARGVGEAVAVLEDVAGARAATQRAA